MPTEYDEMLGYDADHNDPRQYCKHGTFIGSWWGPDYLCWACEDGTSDQEFVLGRAHNAIRHYESSLGRCLPKFLLDDKEFNAMANSYPNLAATLIAFRQRMITTHGSQAQAIQRHLNRAKLRLLWLQQLPATHKAFRL